MQVDWITTIAQIINFLVLVYLLKRFLYAPIVSAMTNREAKIAQRLDLAQQQSTAAQQQMEDYHKKVHQFDQQREQLLEEAKREAEAQRIQLMDMLRGEIATIRERWQGEVQREQQAFLAQARKMVGEQVCVVARQALGDLADAELEEQMLGVFIKQLTEVTTLDKAKLASSAVAKGLTVHSRFPLSTPQQKKISATIHGQIGPEIIIHFEPAPELICGINLKGEGFKLEWNIDSYLSGIDEQLAAHLTVITSDT